MLVFIITKKGGLSLNKQEAIKKLESYKMIGTDAKSACYNEAIKAGILVIKQLDEPQKLVVPKFLDEYMKENEGEHAADIFSTEWLYEEPNVLEEKVAKWLLNDETEENNRRYLIAVQAFVTGDYEVEKEPLYMVPLLTDKEGNKKILVERRGEYDIIWDYENEDNWHELLTEEQIKSVNPDYWKFAVLYEPSEEVAAG